MKRMALILLVWLAGISAALAQNVTVVGPITPGDCPQFSSTTVIKDSGFNCNGSPAVSFANPAGSVGLTGVNGAATTAMRSDAAPPLSSAVQSALTATVNQVLTGTGAFGFSSITNTQLTALINPFTSSLPGAVPASGGGTTNFLRADGTFAVPPASSGTVVPPQVRITLTSGVAVMTGSVTGATSVLVTPSGGGVIPIWNGSSFVPTQFAEVSQATTDTTKSPAAVAASSNYDILCWIDSGTNRCTRSPAWTSNTSRGTGAGTAELQLTQGILVNKNAITNGPAAGFGTYVGSIHSNGSSTIDYILGGSGSGGVAVSLGVWNYYNRVYTASSTIDTGATYTYSTATTRQARASTGNQATVMIGVVEDVVSATYMQRGDTPAAAAAFGSTSIGLDACNAITGVQTYVQTPAAAVHIGSMRTLFEQMPSLGSHFYCAEETGDGSNLITYNGGTSGTLTVKIWN